MVALVQSPCHTKQCRNRRSRARARYVFGWVHVEHCPRREHFWPFSPLTPALSPLRGEGDSSAPARAVRQAILIVSPPSMVNVSPVT